jgi:ligand-binding SRPBCC domain-containing protein
MSYIHLTTVIYAPVERVFDLARNISLQKQAMTKHDGTVLAGKTSGQFEINDTITWQARHLGKTRQLRMRISAMDIPAYFKDEMISGDFTSLQHEHYFKSMDNGSIMIDKLTFSCPYGRLGIWADKYYLHKYMKKLMLHRNATIKSFSESNRWMTILS